MSFSDDSEKDTPDKKTVMPMAVQILVNQRLEEKRSNKRYD